MSRTEGLNVQLARPLSCPQCQCVVVMRTRRSALSKLLSKQKHYICRACHTEFREDKTILIARYEPVNLVI